MGEPLDDVASALVWLQYATDDLALAGRALQAPALPGPACFHAQQAAEKALKGYLTWLGAPRIPRTHDLQLLTRLIAEQDGEAPPEQAIHALSTYPADIRYPGWFAPPVPEAEEALRLAHEVLAFVRTQVTPPDDPI